MKILNSMSNIAISGLIAICSTTAVYADDEDIRNPVTVEMFAPAKGDQAGIEGRGWFVDLAIVFEEGLTSSGFSQFQITGPGPHDNVAPFPGTFSPGADDRMPGLIVLVQTTTIGAKSCQNLANLFNLTGVTNVDDNEVELWDTWIVGAPLFGVNTKSKIFVAVADDINNDGIYNDAPDVLPDVDGNGVCNKKDLRNFGIASNIAKAKFFIN